MTRHADPRRIYEAGRAAIRNRLLSAGMDREAVELLRRTVRVLCFMDTGCIAGLMERR